MVSSDLSSTSSHEILKRSLLNFFAKGDRFKTFYDVVNKKTDYSLRVLEWFVTKYAEKYGVIYMIPVVSGGGGGSGGTKMREVNVAADYHIQMASYQKKCFDPFRRHTKFYISDINNGLAFMTTVCQMNFFKWAIENRILDYVQNHLEEIKEDMLLNSHTVSGTSSSRGKSSKKRSSSSSSRNVRSRSRSRSPSPSSGLGGGGTLKHQQRRHLPQIGSRKVVVTMTGSLSHKKIGPVTCIKRFKPVVLEFD